MSGSDRPAETRERTNPARWAVMAQTLGAVDAVVLGDQDHDTYRIGLTIVNNGDEAPDVDAVVFYPCGTCGWADACGGECHA